MTTNDTINKYKKKKKKKKKVTTDLTGSQYGIFGNIIKLHVKRSLHLIASKCTVTGSKNRKCSVTSF